MDCFEQIFISSAPRCSACLVTTGPVAFEKMFEIVTQSESQVKGQIMTLTSCTLKLSNMSYFLEFL